MGPESGDHPEGGPEELTTEEDFDRLSARVIELMQRPGLAAPPEMDPDIIDESGLMADYTKEGKRINIWMPAPGIVGAVPTPVPPEIAVFEEIGTTSTGNTITQSHHYSLNQYPYKHLTFRQLEEEYDNSGKRVRTEVEKAELEAMRNDDIDSWLGSMQDRIAVDAQLGLSGELSKARFNELWKLLEKLGPADQI